METHLATAERVLMICTERYVEKANSGSGGVGYEKMIVTSELLSNIDSNKVIPLVRQTATNHLPTFLKSKLYIDFSKDDEYEFSIDELAKAIHGAPLFKKPKIGNNPFVSVEESRPERNNDLALDILKVVILEYDRGEDRVESKVIPRHLSISRIIYDVHLRGLIDEGLVTLSNGGYVRLSENGKQYAVKHNLVS